MPHLDRGVRHYYAHEAGYPKKEMIAIKVFTSVGGKSFDRIEKIDHNATKKERAWYMSAIGSAVNEKTKVFTDAELEFLNARD